MEKKIIILSCIILGLTLYSYPVFDNKGISYMIILCCLAAICFAYAKIKDPKENYKSVEKESDRLHTLDGIFQYKSDGFYLTLDNKTDFIKWTDILEVNSFSIPSQYRTRQTGLELITFNKSYEFGDDYTEGIIKLGKQLSENLPNWKLDPPFIRMNGFGLEKANLYKRETPI